MLLLLAPVQDLQQLLGGDRFHVLPQRCFLVPLLGQLLLEGPALLVLAAAVAAGLLLAAAQNRKARCLGQLMV